jgi:hypothetical protein
MSEKIAFKGILEVYEIDGSCDGMNGAIAEKVGRKILHQPNIITNVGFNTIGDRLTGNGTYASTTYQYFAISNGVLTPAATDTASTFYADGTTFTKAVATLETFSTATLSQQWTCFLNSTENTVTSITKFALMNALVGTTMFNDILFAPISKNATKSLYFKYTLTMVRA